MEEWLERRNGWSGGMVEIEERLRNDWSGGMAKEEEWLE